MQLRAPKKIPTAKTPSDIFYVGLLTYARRGLFLGLGSWQAGKEQVVTLFFVMCEKNMNSNSWQTFCFLQSLYQANLAPYSPFSARRTKCAKSALRQVPSRKIRRRLEANCKLLHCDLKIIFARSKNFCTRSLDKDFMYIWQRRSEHIAKLISWPRRVVHIRNADADGKSLIPITWKMKHCI